MNAGRYIACGAGVVAALFAAVAGVSRKEKTEPPSEPPAPSDRQRIVDTALREYQRVSALPGPVDPQQYWDVAAPGVHIAKGTDWCGGFFLAMIKRAGFAAHTTWSFLGDGISRHVRQTNSPEPGDLAYFTRNQHHAMVEAIDAGGVHLINGNGGGKGVTRSTVPRSAVAAFYSIAPLLAEPVAPNLQA
jgi:hypothetical protein